MPESAYWESFYANSRTPTIPSQFAAFTLAEIPPRSHILELGCGNGRDSLFFSGYGHRVIAVDKARQAVDFARKRAAQASLPARFICSAISELALSEDFIRQLQGPLIIYSRFFLHSIDEREEADFLAFCRRCLQQHSGKIFAEFRTDKDESRYKQVQSAHYRRFIRPEAFLRRAEAAGIAAEYWVEGKGFAKYGAEDAAVARVILCRRPAGALSA